MKSRLLIVLAFAGIITSSAYAQNASDSTTARKPFPEEIERQKLLDNTKILFINSDRDNTPSKDSIQSLVNQFYLNQFRHFQDPKAPYFMFMTKDANLAMGIGGRVAVRGVFDWHGAIPANGFAPALIPIPADPTNKTAIKGIPSGTCLFFTLLGRNSRLGNYTAYIEANFNGYSHRDFELKKLT